VRKVVAAGVLLATLASCSGARDSGKIKVVASFYPLAWAARAVGGEAVEVVDLTSTGVEAHDLQLSARQRNQISAADLILIFGKGFQPEVERAARDASGQVHDFIDLNVLLPGPAGALAADPHVWLDPQGMRNIAHRMGAALSDVDPDQASTYQARASSVTKTLGRLDTEFASALRQCALRTLVTTHESFAYLARHYQLRQHGLTGLTPESEPSAGSIQAVRDMVQRREVKAIFYESSDEGRRIGESVARDLGIDALPLNTLEHDPKPNDYISQMRANLESLKKGLQCN
jgi:zinc transport system substrate-binding protein